MSEDVLNPDYWKARLDRASPDQLYKSVFVCPPDRWARIEAKHREILARLLPRYWSVIDVGCGYGRLVPLLPPDWKGTYVGVDMSPAFVGAALKLHPDHAFAVADVRTPPEWLTRRRSDLAIVCSVRPMVIRNAGPDAWKQMEWGVRRCCRDILYLEYDEHDEGTLE